MKNQNTLSPQNRTFKPEDLKYWNCKGQNTKELCTIFLKKQKLKHKSEEATEIIRKNQKDVRNFCKNKRNF